ncbi:hypothetical protein [Solidesulfovibrio sp.]
MPEDHSGHASGFRRLTALAFTILVLCLWAGQCLGQTVLEDIDEREKYYVLTLSGLVGKNSFQQTQAVLTLASSPPGSIHAYVVTVTGWPKNNGENTFVWNSEDSAVESVLGRVTCRIVSSAATPPNMHFFYLSPVLFKREGMVTQHEGERIRQVRKEALPTMIQARAGELTLNVAGQQVDGRVWMTGYDFVEKANVRYQASFQGTLSRELKNTPRIGRND